MVKVQLFGIKNQPFPRAVKSLGAGPALQIVTFTPSTILKGASLRIGVVVPSSPTLYRLTQRILGMTFP
jgi:hypothetical protein